MTYTVSTAAAANGFWTESEEALLARLGSNSGARSGEAPRVLPHPWSTGTVIPMVCGCATSGLGLGPVR